MEPIKINVNIEVGLKQTTIEALASIFNPLKGCGCAAGFDPLPSAPEPQTPKPEKKAEPAKEKKAEPAKEKKAAKPGPAPAPVDDDDDLPPDDAPDPVKPKPAPTEAEMRKVIKEARLSGVTAAQVQDYIRSTFGVATSVECPENRRQELIDGIKQLKKQVA